jgi:hypothetical protein
MHRRRESLWLHSPLESAFQAAVSCHWPALGPDSARRLRPGQRYLSRHGRQRRYGRIIDAQWPVVLALRELAVSPLPMLRVYFRYRFEPRGERTLLLVETRLTLLSAARWLPWVWQSRVIEENRYRLHQLRVAAEAAARRPHAEGLAHGPAALRPR